MPLHSPLGGVGDLSPRFAQVLRGGEIVAIIECLDELEK